ncbi:MAG: hypothetical protein B7Z55_18055, partial [Planctomycetales bacterium 12-60-4]
YMDDKVPESRIEKCRADYAAVIGKPFEHFFCPILRRDEPAQLIRGHIVNEALKTSNAWTPQRNDVDSFYGSVIEADLIAIIEDRLRNPFEVWLDPKRCRNHRPKLVCGGETWGHYFSPKVPKPVSGHTPILITDNDDRPVAHLTLKVAPERILDAKDSEIELVIDRDYRPAIIAAMLKAAHLTLFEMMGYQHVFSAAGLLLSDILRSFYERHGGSHSVTESEIEQFFLPFENMIAPLVVTNDRWFRAATDRFCVFLPTDCGATVNTYFSFVNEPPVSVRAKAIRFRPPSGTDAGAWEADVKDLRIPLRQAMPANEVPRALLVQVVEWRTAITTQTISHPTNSPITSPSGRIFSGRPRWSWNSCCGLMPKRW